jgi:type II secretory pathway pseudopilin PulG
MVVVVGAIIAGLMTAGSPAKARAARLDEQRVRALATITESIESYGRRHANLPATLAELRRDVNVPRELADPVTTQPYGYRATGPRTFEVCAEFQTASANGSSEWYNGDWTHGAGHQCFQREVTKK